LAGSATGSAEAARKRAERHAVLAFRVAVAHPLFVLQPLRLLVPAELVDLADGADLDAAPVMDVRVAALAAVRASHRETISGRVRTVRV